LRLIGRRDILGKRVADVLPEAIEQGFGAVLDRVYLTGERYLAESMPIMLRREPKRLYERRVLDFIYHTFRNAAGELSGNYVQATDVTGRARAGAALRAREDKRRRLNERL